MAANLPTGNVGGCRVLLGPSVRSITGWRFTSESSFESEKAAPV